MSSMGSNAKEHRDGLLQLVTFSVDGEEFGIEILIVKEIIRFMESTKVPNAPEFVEGVINLRGQIIPVIDMRKRFGLASATRDQHTRIIVVEIQSLRAGFIVDAVSEVLRIPAGTVEPAPPMVAGIDSEFIRGVGKLDDRLLILLDLERLFSDMEKRQLAGV